MGWGEELRILPLAALKACKASVSDHVLACSFVAGLSNASCQPHPTGLLTHGVLGYGPDPEPCTLVECWWSTTEVLKLQVLCYNCYSLQSLWSAQSLCLYLFGWPWRAMSWTTQHTVLVLWSPSVRRCIMPGKLLRRSGISDNVPSGSSLKSALLMVRVVVDGVSCDAVVNTACMESITYVSMYSRWTRQHVYMMTVNVEPYSYMEMMVMFSRPLNPDLILGMNGIKYLSWCDSAYAARRPYCRVQI